MNSIVAPNQLLTYYFLTGLETVSQACRPLITSPERGKVDSVCLMKSLRELDETMPVCSPTELTFELLSERHASGPHNTAKRGSSHFSDEKPRAQRGWVTCLRSLGWCAIAVDVVRQVPGFMVRASKW